MLKPTTKILLKGLKARKGDYARKDTQLGKRLRNSFKNITKKDRQYIGKRGLSALIMKNQRDNVYNENKKTWPRKKSKQLYFKEIKE